MILRAGPPHLGFEFAYFNSKCSQPTRATLYVYKLARPIPLIDERRRLRQPLRLRTRSHCALLLCHVPHLRTNMLLPVLLMKTSKSLLRRCRPLTDVIVTPLHLIIWCSSPSSPHLTQAQFPSLAPTAGLGQSHCRP